MKVTAEMTYIDSIDLDVDAEPDDPDFRQKVMEAYHEVKNTSCDAEWLTTTFIDEDENELFDIP